MAKLAIIGSRTFNDYSILKLFVLKSVNLNKFDTIVSGGAKGADTLAEKFAEEFNLDMEVYLPDWNQNGKIAGFLRNQTIIDNADAVIAFVVNKSKGTLDSIIKAKKKGIPVYIWENSGFTS